MPNKRKNSKKEKHPEKWEPCDDCEICKAMKNGTASTMSGLKAAFAKQNVKNGFMTMRVQDKNDLYDDAMDALSIGDFESAEEMMMKAKDMDPNRVQTYVGLTALFFETKEVRFRENIEIAFEKTKERFAKWPKNIPWGFIENREYLRAIQNRADLYADEGDREKAEELYKLVLRLNPNDNQGVRYLLAGLYEGISGEEINSMIEEGNRKQNWSKLERLVERQNKIHNFWKNSAKK